MQLAKLKRHKFRHDDPNLRTIFFVLKIGYVFFFLLWIIVLIAFWKFYESLPMAINLVIGAAIWIFSPDMDWIKFIFMNFESFKQQDADGGIEH